MEDKLTQQQGSLLSPEEQESLKQARLVRRMAQTKGFREILRPWLESKIKHSWLDPRKIKSLEDFHYEYVVAWGFSQAADEILKFVDNNQQEAEHLEKKEEGKDDDPFRIGG